MSEPSFNFVLCSVLLDPATFLAYVGADQVISDADTEDQMGINRSRVGVTTSQMNACSLMCLHSCWILLLISSVLLLSLMAD